MKHNLLLAISTMLLLVSCGSNQQDDVTDISNVKISGTKALQGSASSNFFTVGSKIGLYMKKASATLLQTGNLADNVTFTAGEAGVFTSTSVLKYPNAEKVDIFAYSPLSATGIDGNKNITFTVEANQTKLDDSDLLWESQTGIAATSQAVDLSFDHKLSKIVIKLIAGPSVTLSGTTVKVKNSLPTTKLNVQTGAVSVAEGAAVSITSSKIDDSQLEAIIVPQTIATGVELFEITNNGKTFSYKLSDSGKTFESGKSYTYEITINQTEIDVKFTGAVNDWIAGDTIKGDVL